MNHKYSTIALMVLIGLAILAGVLALESEDIDDICSRDNSTLYRVSGQWMCGSFDDLVINVTVNNITYLYTNYSIFANNSNYLNGYTWETSPYTGNTSWNESRADEKYGILWNGTLDYSQKWNGTNYFNNSYNMYRGAWVAETSSSVGIRADTYDGWLAGGLDSGFIQWRSSDDVWYFQNRLLLASGTGKIFWGSQNQGKWIVGSGTPPEDELDIYSNGTKGIQIQSALLNINATVNITHGNNITINLGSYYKGNGSYLSGICLANGTNCLAQAVDFNETQFQQNEGFWNINITDIIQRSRADTTTCGSGWIIGDIKMSNNTDETDCWKVSNGSWGTTNLSGRFIVASNSTYAPNTLGGSSIHTHGPGTLGTGATGLAGVKVDTGTGSTLSVNTHTHAVSSGVTASTSTYPLYYSLVFKQCICLTQNLLKGVLI